MTDETEPEAAPPAVPTPAPVAPTPEGAPPSPPPNAPATRFRSGFSTLRDAVTFTLGLAIVVHQVFVSDAIDPAAMTVGVALAGLPAALSADEKKNR